MSVPMDTTTNVPAKNDSILVKEIDDDDEFEEFETSEIENNDAGGAGIEPKEGNIWEDNWDDDSAETDFSKQLK